MILAHYTLPDAIREIMKTDEPAVKAALCKIANAQFSTDHPTSGASKYEGGILVNRREISIYRSSVTDDFKPRTCKDITAEEQATINAIRITADIVEKQGISALRECFGTCEHGDPLRHMLRL